MNSNHPDRERIELERPTGVPDLDPVLHFPKRTMIMAVLSASTVADFSFLKEQLELTDSDLSKQMRTLAEAGYVNVRKIGHGRSGSTEYSATRKGRKAYAAYKKQLAGMLGLDPEV
ncbi:DNA-binding MarR family transcriptional regulator [Trueperella bonasi]|uniref:DNA-binding MarR family transcriptional regulator n=1 Tax=Trueperella bonasi TaxID=312286 RepID=A0ABT9NFG7_9ACTO|nr:transcriptional regulator [Trueperella bonasi]MDP9806135.1 DNA-binding MarR family transcriptional regulator [Trueperella bonasi]